MPFKIERDAETKDLLIYRIKSDGSLNKTPWKVYIQSYETLLDGEAGQERLNKINASSGVDELFALLDELDCPNAASFKLHYQQKQKEKRQAEEKERLAEKERQKVEEKRLAEEKQLCSHFEIRYNAFQNRIQFFKEIDGKNGERASIQLETKEEAKELEKSSPFFPVVNSIDFSRYKQQGEVAKTKCQAIVKHDVTDGVVGMIGA